MKNDQIIHTDLFAKIEKCQHELNMLLQKLIQIRSYSGDEKEIVEFIVDKMKTFGFDEAYHDRLGNAVGRIGNGPVKILFDAHIDTVKVTEAEKWEQPPFDGKIVNGKIYGRGAVDEKPAMAGFLIAGQILKSLMKTTESPFTLYVVGSVIEEDADGYPLMHLIQNEGVRPDFVVLGEPTDLRVYRGQRGRMELQIATTGKSAHGAHNQQGINAVYRMAPIIAGIEQLDKKLPVVEPLGKGSITVSQVVTRAPSLCSVPDFCQIHLDRRLTLGESRETAIGQLENLIKELKIEATVSVPIFEGKSWTGTNFQQDAFFPTWLLEESHALTRAGIETASIVSDTPAQLGTWAFSTNGVATAGHFGIPTIGFAPGKEELSHSSREELSLADLLTATKFYTLFPFELTKLMSH